MATDELIEIYFSKKRLTLFSLLFSAFFLIGLLLLVYPAFIELTYLHFIPINNTLLGLILMIFFGYFIIKYLSYTIGNKPGITIDNKGIIDTSMGYSAGQILWTDVKEIKLTTVSNHYFVVVIVKNPEYYLDKQSGLKRKIMQGYYKNHGSPIMISLNGLECNSDELVQVLQNKHKKALQIGSTNI